MRVLLMKNDGDVLIGEVTRDLSKGWSEHPSPTPAAVNSVVGHTQKEQFNLLVQPQSRLHVC